MWGNDQYTMPNMMDMSQMMQNMMPPPLMPPVALLGALNMPPVNSAPAGTDLVDPVAPDFVNVENMHDVQDDVEEVKEATDVRRRSKEKRDRDGHRDRDRSSDRGPRHHYDHNDRTRRKNYNDRNDLNRDKDSRHRRSKWDNKPVSSRDQSGTPNQNMMTENTMMPFSNMNNMMEQQNANPSMSNISAMQAMLNIPGMASMQSMQHNMMSSMTMMPTVINQTMMMPDQPIYTSQVMLLPPIPGTSMPTQREKPKGCRTVSVGGMPKGISKNAIHEIFRRFGDISDVKLHHQGMCQIRFKNHESVEQAFLFSGYRLRSHDQIDSEPTTLFIDYALNREDQNEYERNKRLRESTPSRVDPYSLAAFNLIADKIKSDEHFADAAPTLAVWLERGECNKKNANSFYSLIQASNNQIRRLFAEKMALDDEFQKIKATLRNKFAGVVIQFEQVAKILKAAKHQRVSDHFTKQQRRNIEMWLKMTEEVANIKEVFNSSFDDEDADKTGKNVVPLEKFQKLKAENENLTYELEGYKNEAYLAKEDAERKFEKFKAHFIAQQALQNSKTSNQAFTPVPLPPPLVSMDPEDNQVIISKATVEPSEAKLISILTAFLMVHPLGASLDYLVSYVKSMAPEVTQMTVQQVLQKFEDVFCCKTTGVGASIETRWCFVTFDVIKQERGTSSDPEVIR